MVGLTPLPLPPPTFLPSVFSLSSLLFTLTLYPLILSSNPGLPLLSPFFPFSLSTFQPSHHPSSYLSSTTISSPFLLHAISSFPLSHCPFPSLLLPFLSLLPLPPLPFMFLSFLPFVSVSLLLYLSPSPNGFFPPPWIVSSPPWMVSHVTPASVLTI